MGNLFRSGGVVTGVMDTTVPVGIDHPTVSVGRPTVGVAHPTVVPRNAGYRRSGDR